ncbi:MAG TPA: UxaA family hydrolase [Burkholderiales bacterium]|jgi:altronate dehydratase large subunit|nr:UxaA family hydrolase [Burkholderiales bacterium]
MIQAYLRQDGRKGIRNTILVAYLVECAHHVAREIVTPYREQGIHLIGFSGCYPNAYAYRMMTRLATHPNVGAALFVSLGCEGFNKAGVLEYARKSGRPAKLLVIQDSGGTRKSIVQGRDWVERTLEQLAHTPRAQMGVEELIVGTKCGGSDATSGLTANPAMGRAFDFLVEKGAACIFEETGELIGMEHWMAERAENPALGQEIIQTVAKAARYYAAMGHASFAPGNADGGLTTIEEKSLGAYAKSGQSKISGILKPGDAPLRGGLYLMDMIPDGEPRWGFPNINDNVEVGELIACGAHLVLFSTGRGSVVGSAISPVIKVCANPKTYQRMADDMDVDAGRILEGKATLDEVGREIYDLLLRVAAGEKTKSEGLGHQEFVLTYKSFEALGPACFPSAA